MGEKYLKEVLTDKFNIKDEKYTHNMIIAKKVKGTRLHFQPS